MSPAHRHGFLDRCSTWARTTAYHIGSARTFLLVFVIVLTWSVSWAFLHFSDKWWRLFEVTSTVVTFLLLFLIQHAQNRDTAALQVKLDELIRAVSGARNEIIQAEEEDDVELERLREDLRHSKDIPRR